MNKHVLSFCFYFVMPARLRLILLLAGGLSIVEAFAGNDWTMGNMHQKRFIENKSQFDELVKETHSKILFGIDGDGTKILFTKHGLTYRFDNPVKDKNRKKGSPEPKYIANSDLVFMQWEGANPDVQVIAEELAPDYFSYTKTNGENINYVKGYQKLVYKNLYPNIDAEYIFPEGKEGVKYSLILHPGADASQIKMKYSKNVSLDQEGSIRIPTKFGDIIDHAPFTFYADNHTNIPSAFSVNNDVVSFELKPVAVKQQPSTIIIDPWTQTPSLPNSNGVWECEVDGAGNVYIIGGCMPMKLLKYGPAGGAPIWTYTTPYDTANYWLGTLATDLAGNSYVTSGSIAGMQKVNSAGALQWTYTAPGLSVDEYWTISFNCDQTMLVVGGTTGAGFPSTNLEGAIFNINTANGNIIGSPQIVGAMFNTFPAPYINEVRTLTASKNARYYYLTLDTIGCIDQNFSVCPSGGPIFATSSGYTLSYKCENFRPNNGNGGIKAIRANGNFVYTQNGANVQKRNLANGAVITTVAIPGGISTANFGRNTLGNSGLDIDSCGNVYVGSANQVVKYDANLNFISSTPTSYVVSDVAVSYGGNIISCGTTGTSASTSRTGYVQSSSMANCDPMTLVCCNANVCPVGPFCATDPAQTLTASTSGGTWSGTGITNTSTGVFDPSVSGTGTFVITYTLACGTGSVTIVVNPCIALTVCLEGNGDLTVTNGTGPYQWFTQGTTQDCSQCLFPLACAPPAPNCPLIVTTWSNFGTGTTVTPPGTWPILLVSGTGDSLIINSTAGLPNCSPVSATATFTQPACNGQCSGTATVTQTGGTAPITYSWNTVPAQTTPTATGLCAGSYSVLVTDANGNTATANVTVTQPSPLAATTSVTAASCGSSNGSATVVNVTNGTSPYTYLWNTTPTQTAATATGLTGGNYSVTITDANGCTQTVAVLVGTSPGFSATMASTDPLCNGGSNGSATATPTGGTGPYTYSWSTAPVQSSQTATGLSSGTYSVLITDAAGCIGTQTVTLFQPAAITSTVTTTSTTCGATTGTALVSASGGTGGLTYSWNPGGQTTPGISNLGAGTYSCTVTDANGCTQISSGTVANANGPIASILSQTNPTCVGSTNGSATASATGGTSPYTYSWNTTPPQTTANATGLTAGNYVVTVTDASGCSNTQTVTITAPAAMTASTTITQASCGQSDGTATASGGGGTSPYTYTWNTFQSTQTITGLAAGSYSVLVTDANGCTQSAVAVVTNAGGPTAFAGTTTTILAGGSANLSSLGGVTYSWAPSTGLSCVTCQNTVASPTQTTEYCVFVFDAAGCSDSMCVTVYVLEPCVNTYYIPNAFSPNGDGENDVLQVFVGDISCIKEFSLAVYDRWGEKVFESDRASGTWDGKHKGKIMDTQVLAYYLHIIFSDATEVDKQGNISLVR